jgi:hypothetical protein
MKIYIKISVFLILIMLTANLSAQDSNCNISKTFPVKKGSAFKLINKYGDVNFIKGKDDSLSVCATITIVQNDNDLLQRNIKLVTIRFERTGDTIYASTLYDKKFFSEASRAGRKSFSVDYMIKAPAYMDLSITDEFGNVAVEELSGNLIVRLSQGNMSAKKLTRGNIKPINSVNTDHGKIDIDELNWMNLTVRNCQTVNIGKAQALILTSSMSKLMIRNVGSLICNSKSDNYNIKSANNIISESIYSEYAIGKLEGQLNSKAAYGSINISEINRGFSNLDIVSDHVNISLRTSPDISFRADINSSGTIIEFPEEKYPGILKSDSDNSTFILGKTGTEKETKSLIKIRAISGKLSFQVTN